MVMFSALQHHSCKWSPNSIKAPTDNTLKTYSCLLLIAQQLALQSIWYLYWTNGPVHVVYTKQAQLSDSLFLFALQNTNMYDD